MTTALVPAVPVVHTFPVGLLGCNCTVVADPQTHEAIVVDPGADAPRILKVIADGGYRVSSVVHTHAHIDHVGGTADVCTATGAPGFLHQDDDPLYGALAVQAHMLGLPQPAVWEMRALKDGGTHGAGAVSMGVLHTPGHTMGSCCFLLEKAGLLFTGDTLFRRGVGRTDLGGDHDTLMSTIRDRLFTLPEQTVVIPGHGPRTTVGEERAFNPFF